MPDALRFRATCPLCAEERDFLAVRIEDTGLTQTQVAAGERPGLEGFRCLSCSTIVGETDDPEGFEHRWEQGQPVTYPIKTGVPDQSAR